MSFGFQLLSCFLQVAQATDFSQVVCFPLLLGFYETQGSSNQISFGESTCLGIYVAVECPCTQRSTFRVCDRRVRGLSGRAAVHYHYT